MQNKKKNKSKIPDKPSKPVKKKTAGNSLFVKYLPFFLLGGLIILVYVIRSNFLEIPFERDEGDYFYIAQLILDGKVPYIDFYEQKLPGLFYSYSLIIMLFGASLKGAHLGFLFINILTMIMLFFIGKKLFNSYIAFIIALSFSIFSLAPHMSGFTTQSEHLVIFFASGGFLALIYALKNQKLWYLFLISGILICFSFLVKQSAVFFILAAGMAIVAQSVFNRPVKWKILIKNVLLYSFGVFFSYGIILLVIYRYDALDEMWYWTIDFAGNYVSEFPWSEGVKQLKLNFNNITENYTIFWVIASLGFLMTFFAKKSLALKVSIMITTIFSVLTIVPGLRFYGHYWIQLTPVLAVLTGVFFFGFYNLLKKKFNSSYIALILLTVFILISISHFNSRKEYYFNPDKTEILREVYGMNPFPESKVVSDFIAQRTVKEDKIAVLGSEPQIYFYTDRRCASKHHYITFLMGDTAVFPMNREYQKEFIADIETNKPKFLVYFKHYISWLRHPAADTTIDGWFNEFSAKNYNLVGVADMISPRKTNYVWYQDVMNYTPQGEFIIGIFEIKNETDTIANLN